MEVNEMIKGGGWSPSIKMLVAEIVRLQNIIKKDLAKAKEPGS